jgi:hypothetical protein
MRDRKLSRSRFKERALSRSPQKQRRVYHISKRGILFVSGCFTDVSQGSLTVVFFFHSGDHQTHDGKVRMRPLELHSPFVYSKTDVLGGHQRKRGTTRELSAAASLSPVRLALGNLRNWAVLRFSDAFREVLKQRQTEWRGERNTNSRYQPICRQVVNFAGAFSAKPH